MNYSRLLRRAEKVQEDLSTFLGLEFITIIELCIDIGEIVEQFIMTSELYQRAIVVNYIWNYRIDFIQRIERKNV